MHCPSCDFENPAGMKFCGACAAPLPARCAACGFDNPSQFKFCGACATPLQAATLVATATPLPARPPMPSSAPPQHLAEKILTSRSALEGERKQVTVLFADHKGAIALLADRDPEEARQ